MKPQRSFCFQVETKVICFVVCVFIYKHTSICAYVTHLLDSTSRWTSLELYMYIYDLSLKWEWNILFWSILSCTQ